MQFTWNEETIRWYINSSAYSGFYRNIAKEIAPSLKEYKTLADFGCGLGLFDFEVHDKLEKIECIDCNEAALQSIRSRAETLGIKNIVTRSVDCFQLSGEWDVIYMSFFGSRELDSFLPFCRKLFAVVTVTGESEMFPMKQPYKRNTVDDTARYLESKGVPYTLKLRQYEFGQPLVSIDDARRCVRQYVPDISDGELEEYLRRRLTQTDNAVYPYYMPRMKSVGIFELDGALTPRVTAPAAG